MQKKETKRKVQKEADRKAKIERQERSEEQRKEKEKTGRKAEQDDTREEESQGKNRDEESKSQRADQQRSPAETAEEFLQSKGLVEGFNSTRKLENDLTKNLQQIRSSSGTIGVATGPQYRSELKRRVVTKKTEIINRWLQLQRQPSDNGGPRDQEFVVLESWIYPTGLGPKVKDDIAVIQAIHREVNAEFKARAASNPLIAGLIADIRRAYGSLAGDSRVQAALKTVGGTLAEPPEIPASTNDIQAEVPPLEEEPSGPAKTSEQVVTTEDGAAGSDAADKAKDEKDGGGKSEEQTASFDELKEQLTALEKETRKTLGAFNKEAKDYLKKKKDLAKRIKKSESVIASLSKFQDSLPDGDQKTKFGQETEAKYVKPLTELKTRLQSLAKPDAVSLEEKLKQSEKLIAQLKKTSVYAESPKSVDSLAEKIAKYRLGLGVQQTKMAK